MAAIHYACISGSLETVAAVLENNPNKVDVLN
jgi:hypothetical protein